MKITFVSYHYWPPHFGGELLLSIERFESLVQRGHTVTVLTSGNPEALQHETIRGIQVIRSPLVHSSKPGRGLRRLIFPFWVLQKLRSLDYEILHLGSAGGIGPVSANFFGFLICQLTKKRKKKIVVVHSLADTDQEMYSEKGIARKIRRLCWKKANAIVSVSPALHACVLQYFLQSARYIPNGIHNDLFKPLPNPERLDRRQQMGINESDVIFSFLGSVGFRKGFDLLTQAFLDLHQNHPKWRLWVIGPYSRQDSQNIEEARIAGMVSQLSHLPGKVKLWGRIDDRVRLAELLAVSDVYVLPTRKEGMPLAPLEAMAAGLPAILSRIPGVTDMAIIDGKTGIFVDVDDLPSLEAAMINLGNDKEMRKKMGTAAAQRVNAEFGWYGFIDQWEKMYQSLLDMG